MKVCRLLLLIVVALVLSVAAVPASAYLAGKNSHPSMLGEVTSNPPTLVEATKSDAKDEANFIYHQLQEVQEQEAQGRYSQACKALLQTLTGESLDCESLKQDENFSKIKTTLDHQFSNLGKPVNDLLKFTTLRGFGDALGMVVSLDKSMAVLQLSLKVARQISFQAEAEALLSLGNTAQTLGNKKRDTEDSISTKFDDRNLPDIEAQPTLPDLSLDCSYEDTNNKVDPEAMSFYQKALVCYRQAASKAESSTTHIQAQIYLLSLLLKIEQWERKNGYDSFAENWWSQAKYQIPNITQIQEEIEKLPLSRVAVYIRINFVRSLIYLRQLCNANTPLLSNIEQLLTNINQTGDRRIESYVLGNLGWVYEQETIQNPDKPDLTRKALKLTQQALELAENINARDLIYQWEWQKGRILKAQKNTKEAIYAYAQAFNSIQLLRTDLLGLNIEIQFQFLDSVDSVCKELADLLLQYEPTQGALELRLQQNDNKNSTSQIVKHEEYDARISNANFSQQNLILTLGIINSLQLAELENFLQCNLLSVSSEPVNKVAEDTSAAVFYPIILEDRLEVIFKLPQQELKHFSSPIKRNQLEVKLKKLQFYLKQRDSGLDKVETLSSDLYNWLIRPAEKDKDFNPEKIKTLVFVLDCSLRNIPMSALWDREQKQYLINKYAVAITPELSLLGPKPLKSQHLKALIAGLTNERQLNVNGHIFSFGALPDVRDEIDAIKKIIPNSEYMRDDNFKNKDLLRKFSSSSYSIVHLATHGNFSSNPQETFILTASDAPININELQNLFQVRKQSRSDAIELLVLSACETATGDRRAPLGLAGVAVRAGALSTLATLWSVNNKSTTELVKQFYQNLVNKQGLDHKPMTKAEALRQAQLYLLQNKQGEYRHPYYWAPFILIGNWL